jgi:putative transposase
MGIDEYLTRKIGYAKVGCILELKVSGQRYQRQSVMAIRNHNHKLVDPMIYQGTADSNTVIAYFELILPRLEKRSIVILDNASYHKSIELQELFKNNNHNHTLMFLPSYSPDLNPIENLWGTIKQHLRNYYNHSLSLFDNLCEVVNLYSV